jgi:hypothetical protein
MIEAPLSLLFLLFLALIVFYWLHYMTIKELAINYCRHRCKQKHYLLLDETIALTKTRFSLKRRILTRQFEFDYADAGNARHTGRVTLHGKQVIRCDFDTSNIEGSSTRHKSNDNKVIPFRRK